MACVKLLVVLLLAVCLFSESQCKGVSGADKEKDKELADKISEESSLKDKLQSIPSAAQSAAAGVVVFDATRTTDAGPFSVTTVVVFETTELTKGDGYDPGTSIFTAPVPGIYSFSFTMASVSFYGYLEVNGVIKLSIWNQDGDNGRSHSSTLLVELVEGDQVQVTLAANFVAYCSRQPGICKFSGVLLHQSI